MLAFYCDHHIRSEIARGLRSRGVNVLTAFEDGRSERDDEDLLIRATELDRILVTQDKGFHRIVKRWWAADRGFPGILFAIQERVDIGDMIEYMELFAHVMSAEEMRDRLEYIPTN